MINPMFRDVSQVSYYINSIEIKLNKLKDRHLDTEYNRIFDTPEDFKFKRKLMYFNEKLNKLIDTKNNKI